MDELLGCGPDLVIVATPHGTAGELVTAALRGGARVLMEKPLGRSVAEANELVARQTRPGQLSIGLSYRYFAVIAQLLGDARAGTFGEPISLTLVMGHGHHPGVEQGWKLDPVEAGGGALLDPGIHLLDLALLLGGPTVTPLRGAAFTGFWNTGVEEEAHVILTARDVPVINLQVSVVRWRSTFSLTLVGTDGYGIVEGRGRSYGPQTYRTGERWAWRSGRSQADSETVRITTDGAEVFADELAAVLGLSPALPEPASTRHALSCMDLESRCRAVLAAGARTS
jgi:predicted dehydrogenase